MKMLLLDEVSAAFNAAGDIIPAIDEGIASGEPKKLYGGVSSRIHGSRI